MNRTLVPFLRKFMLVFMDDLLIYSKSWRAHLQHVDTILSILRNAQFYAKKSKCSFGTTEMEYLGHIVSANGVKTDPAKITTLNKLLKKEAFCWNPQVEDCFERVKKIMTSTPILATPNFSKPFILECDASGLGMGPVLMQEGGPIAFESRILKGKEVTRSTYDKEMLAIIHALTKWRQYLLGSKFIVKTDHNSLQYILKQKELSPEQQKWVSKIQAYEFEVVYKKGKLNVATDALSCRDEDGEYNAITEVIPKWITEVQAEYAKNSNIIQLISEVQQGLQDKFEW
eukprot:Gb_02517 [translate_table: standard]